MRKLSVIALLSAVAWVGCGSDPKKQDPLVGAWELMPNSQYDCVLGLHLEADSRYVQALICSQTGGSIGAEVEHGTWTDANGVLTTEPDDTSCPSHKAAHTTSSYDYTVSAGRLSLRDSHGVLDFSPVTDTGSSSSAIQYGCWDSGVFTAGVVVPLH